MKNLNLVHLNKSDIKYTVQNFPDGQRNIVLKTTETYEFVYTEGLFDQSETRTRQIKFDKVKIISRLNNMEDMGLIICATACLRRLGAKEIHLYVPYLLGARSDRQFEEGGNSYLVDVIAPLINAQNFASVTVLDVHNPDVTAACIKNLVVQSNLELVRWSLISAFKDKYERRKGENLSANNHATEMHEDLVLISPDAGASKKIQKVADAIGYKGDIITCSKVRDTDGKLTKTVVPISDLYSDSLKDHIIIDDIGDRFGTFINIAKTLKEKYSEMNNEGMKGKIYLIVTHAIQDEGIELALEHIDSIFTTNSYKDRKTTDSLKVLNIF